MIALDPDGDAGTVHLVGAGPGDPELLTVKAVRLIEGADVVLADSLVSDGVMDVVPDDVPIVDVGKRSGGGRRVTQQEINGRLVWEARKGNEVVRLKGGDPTVFGRGGEEAQHLADEGVPFEVVPGITSAVAAPELAGIPPTHRDHASSITVVTGHEDPSKPDSAVDWDALAGAVEAGGTLVILMGVGRLDENMAALRRGGVDLERPAALVEKATWDDERVVTGTVGSLPDRRHEAGVTPPAVTVVGDVVEVRDDLVDVVRSAAGEETPSAAELVEVAGAAGNGAPPAADGGLPDADGGGA